MAYNFLTFQLGHCECRTFLSWDALPDFISLFKRIKGIAFSFFWHLKPNKSDTRRLRWEFHPIPHAISKSSQIMNNKYLTVAA